MTTALHRCSKADTVLLLDASLADIYVDHGPERTSLADQTTYMDESPSARCALDAPRNITVMARMQSSWSGVLLELGNVTDYSFRVALSAGELSFAETSLLRARVAVPGLSGVDSVIVINWSQRTELGNVIDDIAVCNVDTGEWAFGTGSHTASTPDASHTLTVAAAYGGASAYTGTAGAVLAVHIGRRFHSATEAREDWVTESTPPVLTARRRMPMITGPSDELLISNEGQMAGPAYLWALAATRQADSRTLTPLVNVVTSSGHIEDNSYAPVWYFRKAPDSAVYHMALRYLWHAIAPGKANFCRVRVHAAAWNTVSPGTIATIHLRMYSMSNLPVGQKAPGPLTYYKVSATIAAETISGEWVDLGLLRIAREASGLAYFWLAYSIGLDTGASIEDDTRMRINAVTVEPLYVEADDDQFDLAAG